MDLLRRSFRRSTRRREPLSESPNVDSPRASEKNLSPTTFNRLQNNFRRSFRRPFAPMQSQQYSNTEPKSMMDKLRNSFRRRSLRKQPEAGTFQTPTVTSHNTNAASISPSPAQIPFRRSFNGRRGPLFVDTKCPNSYRNGIDGPSFTLGKLRRSIRRNIGRPKETSNDLAKLNFWQSDEMDVRTGTCFFNVKYLGCMEVFESQGILMCEAAFKILTKSRKRPIKSLLFISANGFRVIEQNTRALIVDQSLNMLSFCGPVRNHCRGFAFICLNPSTLKWMCYCFVAKESGERLSYAVGCAIRLYFELQEKRDKECKVTMNFDLSSSNFTRVGSLRPRSMIRENGFNESELHHSRLSSTNGITIPTTTIININNNISAEYDEDKENIPIIDEKKGISRSSTSSLDFERTTFTAPALLRQRSFRELSRHQDSSSTPFKRQLSLRLKDLPSNAERLKFQTASFSSRTPISNLALRPKTTVSPIEELSPATSVENRGLEYMTRIMKKTREMRELTQKLSVPVTNDAGIMNSMRKCASEDAFVMQKTNEVTINTPTQVIERPIQATPTVKCSRLQDCSLGSNDVNLSPSCRVVDLSNSSGNSQQLSLSSVDNIALTPSTTPTSVLIPLTTSKLHPWQRDDAQGFPQMSSPTSRKFHTRSYSLSYAESMMSSVTSPPFADPFHIEWTSSMTKMTNQKPKKKNTNPFLTDSPIDIAPVQSTNQTLMTDRNCDNPLNNR